MITTFAAHAVQELEVQIDLISKSLNKGSAKSYEEYRQMAGSIAGMRTAIHVITELADAADRQD